MLSRVALAPRLGLAAARASSRPVASSLVYGRPAGASLSPWIRTYAKGKGPSNPRRNNAFGQQQPAQSSQPGGGSAAPGPAAAQSASTSSKSGDSNAAQQPPKKGDADATSAATNPEQDPTVSKGEEEPIPFDKLPDLTQGIPSTLEAEMEDRASSRSDSSLQTIAQNERQRRERDDPFMTSVDRNRRWWSRFFMASAGVGSIFGVLYLGRGWDDEAEAARHPDIPASGWSPGLWWTRVKARFGESMSYYQDPAFEKLLPDPDPTFERPYTLCISLDDMLIHSEWSREHGWRVAKRPGFDYFVRYLSQYYELVLFTSQSFGMADPIVRKLDPFHFIIWPLYREATKYEDGEIVKDLSYLNRDLSKVIIMDTKAEHVRKQPENAIIMKPWTGDRKDNDLVGMIPFLEYICTMQYSDVRKILKSFDGKHIPTEFARREAIARKEFNKQLQEKKSKHSKPSGFGALGNALGLKPSNMSMTVSPDGEQNPSEAFAQGKMLQDIARERGQRNYEMLEAQIREHGEKWLKEEQEAMEKAQQEMMASMTGSFAGWFTSKPSDSGSGSPKPSNP